MNELIEKMKADGLWTGMIEHWYKEMMQHIQKCCYLSQNGQAYGNTHEYESANYYYTCIKGFLEALITVNYITEKQRDIYYEHLMEQFEF